MTTPDARMPSSELVRPVSSWRRLGLGAIGCAVLVAALELSFADIARTKAQSDVRDDLNGLRAEIQQVLSLDVQLIRGMMGYVRARPDLSQAEFTLIAQDILEGASGHVRNLALARDLVISHMYPLEGNEAAVGLDYRNTPTQWPAVARVIEENRLVIAGPLELAQGGLGLIARFPIHQRAGPDGDGRLWGIASTVIDFHLLLEQVGYHQFETRYHLALVGRDGDPETGDVILGDPGIRDLDPVVLEVVLPYGRWTILAIPRQGWPALTPYLPYFIAAALLLFAGFAALTLIRHRIATERHRAALEIVNALQRAEAASSAKSSFMAVMSHELRTPLNAIIGFSSLLEAHPKDSRVWDKASEYVTDIRRSGEFLLSMINDILDLARIESGRHDLELGAFDVAASVRRCVRPFRVEFELAGMTVMLPPEGVQLRARGDARGFQQIMNNLLSNALKYAGKGSTVRIGIESRPDRTIRITVVDDGPGIPVEKIEHAMQPFVQLSSAHTRSVGGVGLGLAICRALALAMGGSLSIKSSSGAGVSVELLLQAAAEAG